MLADIWNILYIISLYYYIKALKAMATQNFLPDAMSTLSEVMELLAERGFDQEMKFSPEGKLEGMGRRYAADELILLRTYRFEGISDPEDNAALYLFSDKEERIGYLVDIYGQKSNYGSEFADFLREVPVQNGSPFE
jgi:hypothetical protein